MTAQVQNEAQKRAHPNARIIVPKAGTLQARLTIPARLKPGEELSLVSRLRIRYEINGNPGRFFATRVGSILTVQPVAVRDASCKWSRVTPAMETRISFPTQTRRATEALTVVLGALTHRLGVKVGGANLPMVEFANQPPTLGASDEPANVVLVRLFGQLSGTNRSKYYYHLLYDPGLKYYLISIHAVQPKRRAPF